MFVAVVCPDDWIGPRGTETHHAIALAEVVSRLQKRLPNVRVCKPVRCQLEGIVQFVDSRLLQSTFVDAFQTEMCIEKFVGMHQPPIVPRCFPFRFTGPWENAFLLHRHIPLLILHHTSRGNFSSWVNMVSHFSGNACA